MAKYNMNSKYTHEVDDNYREGWDSIFGKKSVSKKVDTYVESGLADKLNKSKNNDIMEDNND